MFDFSSLDSTLDLDSAAKALWAQCLLELKQSNLSQQLDYWLEGVRPQTLILSPGEQVMWILHCSCEHMHKINAIITQFSEQVELTCSNLCSAPVYWRLDNLQNSLPNGPQNNLQNPNSVDYGSQNSSETSNLEPYNHSALKHTTSAHNIKPLTESKDDTQASAHYSASDVEDLGDNDQAGIHTQLTFERFVVGRANQMANAAARQVAMQPGVSYNPFFLYGGVGLGKTHLIHAIGNEVLANNPKARIRYIHANQFVADVVSTYRRGTYDAFKRYYHGLDMLLIDDIQFFADKKRTQEEFFYAFEALVANRSQIVLTSDTYPKEMADIESRLISRFNAGLVATIEPPELEMRVAILQEKAKILGVYLLDDVAFYIAKSLKSNVRELEGALNKLLAYSRFQNSDVSLEMAKVALRDLITSPRGILTVENIQKVVADYYKVKVSDLYGKRRLANVVLPRQVAMYLSKELTQKSLPDIGEAFGGRDHTTVLYAVKKIAQEKNVNPQLNHHLHVLEQTLNV